MRKTNGHAPDWAKLFLSFSANPNMSGIDMNKFLNLYKRNLEAWTEVSRVGANCAQAFTRAQSEAVQQGLHNLTTVLECIAEQGSTGQQKARKSSEILQDAWQNSTANAKELAQVLTRSNREAFEILNARMKESASELQDIVPAELRRTSGKR
ncbi:MAG: hypothetical protein EYC62_05325 [Alphaproteobacteria bacterium]|nr:MAG: hypothetical protein EYC62_05325 [Alphaproteobacteria bacterium]